MQRKLSMEELERDSLEEFKIKDKIPVIFLMDNVRSALNIGSAFRTADSFNIEKIVLCGLSATPPHREILKTALGADETVEWKYFDQVTDAVLELKNNGYQILAIEQLQEKIFLQSFQFDKNKKYVFIFGNEVNGVSDEIISMIDGCIEIPQSGTKHSLNVSVCVGIIGWEVYKQYYFN